MKDRLARPWRALGGAVVLWALCALTPALAQTLSLEQVATATTTKDLAVLKQALDDPQLLASLEAIDLDAASELQTSIGDAFSQAGDKASALKAYNLAIASIAKAHGGHDDLTQVVLLRRTAALRRDLGDLAGAVDDIDKAFGIATAAKHPSLAEVRGEYTDIRQAFATANPGKALPEPYQPRGGEPTGYDVVQVFYATHRKPTGATEPAKFFAGDRGPLNYGSAFVSVPKNRAAGAIPKPSFWRGEFRPDPNHHVILTNIKPSASRNAFFADVSGQVAKSSHKEVFVFIHGFNNSFEDAAERSAQMAADLAIDGAPILYSWPSKANLLAYGADEQEAEIDSQIADLADFLTDVAQRSGADHVNLVAHSMGNRFLIKALNKLAERPAPARPKFDEVVLAAPDVGVDDFGRRWPQVRTMGKRFTLYASSRDKALLISGKLHDMQRIGDAHKIVVTDGLQTIDTTAASGGLLGHTDFDGSALDDFRGLIWYSLAPDTRCVLQTDQSGGQTFWVFAGPKACPEPAFREAVSLARSTGSPKAAVEKVHAMITDLGREPAAAADLSLLRNVEQLLLAFPG